MPVLVAVKILVTTTKIRLKAVITRAKVRVQLQKARKVKMVKYKVPKKRNRGIITIQIIIPNEIAQIKVLIRKIIRKINAN